MAKYQVTLTSLGLVTVTLPEKRMASKKMVTVVVALPLALTLALLVTLFLSFSELCCPYDIGQVYDIAHTLTDLEK